MAEPMEPPLSAEPPDEFLIRHLPLIERIAHQFAANKRLLRADDEDFCSFVKEKLLEDDYRRIRAYRGACPVGFFLRVTIGCLGKDFLDKIWRKWRPCAAAERLGPVGIELDRLLSREGISFEEACARLLARRDIQTSREELERFHRELPARPRRRTEGEDVLGEVPAPGKSPEEEAIARDVERKRDHITRMLRQALKRLPAGDQTLLRLSFGSNLKIAEIARQQKTDQKSLYRRRDKIYRRLREELEKLGLDKGELGPLLGGS